MKVGGCFTSRLIATLVLAAVTASPALAHGGQPGKEGSLWLQWSWTSLAGLAALGAGYGFGLRRLWLRAGAGRGIGREHGAVFAAGLAALLVALVSPIDALSEELFSAHMVQHLLLVLVAAPLLVAGRAALALAWLLPTRLLAGAWKNLGGRWAWNLVNHPGVALGLHAAALWFWHMPQPYQAALEDEWLHLIEHGSFFISAMLFWQVFGDLTQGVRSGRSARFGVGILMVFVIGLVNGLLGVLIAFSPYVWYPVHNHASGVFGLTALQDQHLAGVMMWVPASIVYLGSALRVMTGWIFAREALENSNT